jgi:hypothetical protein
MIGNEDYALNADRLASFMYADDPDIPYEPKEPLNSLCVHPVVGRVSSFCCHRCICSPLRRDLCGSTWTRRPLWPAHSLP